MSYPASAVIQSMYRYPITEVARFLDSRHEGKYFVYNMSGVSYDPTPFHGRVKTESWEDHHSPTLHLLADVVLSMNEFLNSDENNVVVVHCNAGKGRTGTLICCYLMFAGLVQTAEDAI